MSLYPDALYDDEPISYDVEPEPIHGTDVAALDRADWHVRQIARLRAEQESARELFQLEIRRLTDRLEHRLSVLKRQEEWHKAPVEALHRALLAEDPKNNKTKHLRHGKLLARSVSEQVHIEDRDAVKEWALTAHPDLCPPKDPLVTELRRVVKIHDGKAIDPATGEVIPGTRVEPARVSFWINTGSEEPF